MPLAPGDVLHNNRYRIVRLLGQGGMGAVYRAWDTILEIPVAIKENLDTSPEAQRQFTGEARILARLAHPSLPRVIDTFFAPGQGQYLVMDFVDGEDLQSMLDRLGALPEPAVLAWMADVCNALAYLHGQLAPIIHRDIKPANIRIRPDGRAMLVDFGIAKVYDPSLATTVGARAVAPGYSPPEQYGGGRTDARSDVYALGATLYHLLTGEQPPESVGRMAGVVTLSAPRRLNPAITPKTEGAVLRAMEVATDRRFQTVDALRAALPAAAAEKPRQAPASAAPDAQAPPRRTTVMPPQPPGLPSPTSGPPPQTSPQAQPALAPSPAGLGNARKSLLPMALAACALLIVCAFGVWLIWQWAADLQTPARGGQSPVATPSGALGSPLTSPLVTPTPLVGLPGRGLAVGDRMVYRDIGYGIAPLSDGVEVQVVEVAGEEQGSPAGSWVVRTAWTCESGFCWSFLVPPDYREWVDQATGLVYKSEGIAVYDEPQEVELGDQTLLAREVRQRTEWQPDGRSGVATLTGVDVEGVEHRVVLQDPGPSYHFLLTGGVRLGLTFVDRRVVATQVVPTPMGVFDCWVLASPSEDSGVRLYYYHRATGIRIREERWDPDDAERHLALARASTLLTYTNGPIDAASLPPPPAYAPHRLAYITYRDADLAAAYETFLTGLGFTVDVVGMDEIAATDFAPYGLILVGPDTIGSGEADAWYEAWGTQADVRHLVASGRPILGFGDGGYGIFGRMGLRIGGGFGASGEGDPTVDLTPVGVLLRRPNPIEGDAATLYSRALSFNEIYLGEEVDPSPRSAGVVAIASRDYAGEGATLTYGQIVCQPERYCLWGFGASPADLTEPGAQLLQNLIHYLIDFGAPQANP